ncbi:probable disease resistance protein At4g27220 [Neltuma alba]|uniref:probable disease resistance protein At4g27220 n=1 Tax=Neltuma alba TaxID=207710 RepID=UPI0010A34C43|nr:probable disease resistance protein At4g27220 [Prosopis alba]
MECQKRIQLDLLKEDEAWTLFQTHANVNDATKEDMVRKIAMECKGLPIAIVAVGTCLKEKGVDKMRVMLYQLRNAKPNNVDKGESDYFTCLELSYDYLATPEAKLLLLMCAMFPKDHNIDVEDLFRYGVGLGLCRHADSFKTARSQVRATINYLIRSSLLMHSSKFDTNAQEYVIMHDMVCDFALWKASQEDCTIMKLKKLEIFDCSKLEFVLSFTINATTSMLPQLSTLTISDCSQIEEIFKCSNIQDHDFDNGREIVFPNMENMKLNYLPRLVNVCRGFKFHTREFCGVIVHDCPGLMPIMTATVDWTKERLVREYELKYNQLNNNEALNNPPLSILYAGEIDIQSPSVEHKWRVIGDDDEQKETNYSEMLRSEQQMFGGLVPTQVLRFHLPKLTFLTISDCEELEEIVAEDEDHQVMSNVQVFFPELRELKVEGCNKLKRLFSTILSIDECEELEEIMSSEHHFPNASSSSLCFPLLEHLGVTKCRKLKWVFPFLPSTHHLPQLQYLIIEECFELKGLYNCELEIHEEGFINNIFPILSFYTVEDCPNFCKTTLAALQRLLLLI